MTSWIDSELEGSKFKDERLGKRFLKIVKSLSEKFGESVPITCQDWANAKAAYRFFPNPNLSELESSDAILQKVLMFLSCTGTPL